ncbi:MAG: hotdog fold thioesterase [Saprospiraceae bacterium]
MNEIWKIAIDLDQLNERSLNSMVSNLGIRFTAFGPDWLQATMPVDHRTIQPYGILHGGASVALAESLGSIASSLCIADLTVQVPVGVEINANHLNSVSSGQVIGTVKAIKIGKLLHVWNIEIADDKGRLCCVCRLTTAVISTKKA